MLHLPKEALENHSISHISLDHSTRCTTHQLQSNVALSGDISQVESVSSQRLGAVFFLGKISDSIETDM